MDVQFSKTNFYKYELDKELCDWLAVQTNRSNSQTLFLFQLVDGDFEKLKQLEMKIKNCFLSYCPGDMVEVDLILAMEDRCDLLIIK